MELPQVKVEEPRPVRRAVVRYRKKKEMRVRRLYERPSNNSSGTWTIKETVKYIAFLKEHKPLFESEETRRQSQVFIQMAKSIPSRNSRQCRSHHQKKIIALGSIDRIIRRYEDEVIPYFSEKAQKWSEMNTRLREERESPWTKTPDGWVCRISLRVETIPTY